MSDDDIEWPDHASLPPLDPNEPGGGLLAGMGGTLDIGVPLRDAGGRELRSVEIAPGVLWPDYGMVTIEGDDERDARFAPGNDAVWGAGNWIRCSICPRDGAGREVYHHRNAHG